MSNLDRVFELGNLRRAYRWIQSNPDARYKSLFRDTYSAFALASDTSLKRLRQDGLAGRYSPENASKLMMPKASGTLRPITLLTMRDQIVYQALLNVISDLLKPRTKHRYRRRVFAHLYAGKSSLFFNMKWQDSYRLMGKHLRQLHTAGYSFVANFDLASFYDSIDHHVLSHFLTEVGLDHDANELLARCLKQWTSSTWTTGPTSIYHGHGIPQGPLSSGMLSEVVLQHLDTAGERGVRTKYIRYVDDIKVFARSEEELRRKLIGLDLTSKELGLFPQTSKINIRPFDPSIEVKSVSLPPEPSIIPVVNQKRLTSRLLQLSRGGQVKAIDSTRFKYLLSRVKPTYSLNERLMSVLEHHPEHCEAIGAYLSRYPRIPDKLANQILDYAKKPELYHGVTANILRPCVGRMSPALTHLVGAFAAHRLLKPPKGALPLQPTYKEALVAFAIGAKAITFADLESLRDNEKDWWVRKSVFRVLEPSTFGHPSYADFVNKSMRISEEEVSRCAAAKLVEESITLQKPYGTVTEHAKIVLKAAKIIKSAGKPPSLVNSILAYVLRRPESPYDWRKFFGGEHRHAEHMAIVLKQSRETDIDAFIIRFDSFADKITEKLFSRFCVGKNYPAYGSALRHPSLLTAIPQTISAFRALHDMRLQSITAHPRSLKTGIGTRRLKHSDFFKLRPQLATGMDHLETTYIP